MPLRDVTQHHIFFNTGKATILKKVIRKPDSIKLLDSIGREKDIHEEAIEDCKEFIRTVLYAGKNKETYLETRVRLYKTRKIKSSTSLPPDHGILYLTGGHEMNHFKVPI